MTLDATWVAKRRGRMVFVFGSGRYERLLRESERRYQEQLQITREVIRRNELAFQQGSRLLAELVEKVRESTEETKAQTRALLTVLDRLENSGGEAPAS